MYYLWLTENEFVFKRPLSPSSSINTKKNSPLRGISTLRKRVCVRYLLERESLVLSRCLSHKQFFIYSSHILLPSRQIFLPDWLFIQDKKVFFKAKSIDVKMCIVCYVFFFRNWEGGRVLQALFFTQIYGIMWASWINFSNIWSLGVHLKAWSNAI